MLTQLGSLAILGSGETSPNLVSVHREMLSLMDKNANLCLIDSPFGFQENAELLVKKIQDFYKISLNANLELASFRSIEELNTSKFFKFLALLDKSDFIFAGPGSPSYASKMWADNEVKIHIINHLKSGKHALFSSAAAATIGEYTLPVYEIYKVGSDLFWEKGLNLLSLYGLSCTVIPHFNNKEGGKHDTSYSYIGKSRMFKLLKKQYTNLLGIDEHTALILDGKNKTFEVKGLGKVTVFSNNHFAEFKSGQIENLKILQDLLPINNNLTTPSKKEKKIENFDHLKIIADLEIKIETQNKKELKYEKLINLLKNLRKKLRQDKNYLLADELRNILESIGENISDTKEN